LALRYQEELGIKIVPFSMLSYVPSLDQYLPADEVPPNMHTMSISGTQLRHALRTNQPIPDWFSFPEVVTILRQAYTLDKSIV
jgi:sulfate adenylyltransferase